MCDFRVLCWLQDSRASCLPNAPSQTVSESLMSVMSGAKEGSLDHQVKGEPETVAGGFKLSRQPSRGAGPRVLLLYHRCSAWHGMQG
jgi:hypothetical protein